MDLFSTFCYTCIKHSLYLSRKDKQQEETLYATTRWRESDKVLSLVTCISSFCRLVYFVGMGPKYVHYGQEW